MGELRATLVRKAVKLFLLFMGLTVCLGFISLFSMFMELEKYFKVRRKQLRIQTEKYIAIVTFGVVKRMLQRYSLLASLGFNR